MMNIKYVLGALVVILVISNIFCIYEMQSSTSKDNYGVIGNNLIKLPTNYSIVNSSDSLYISDGGEVISIFKLNESNMDLAIGNYKNIFSENFTIKVSSFDSNHNSKKTVAIINDTTISKYWFELNDGIYQIQVYKNNSYYDGLARDIINSMH